jgi:tetratricopeptide (TPR) repeat protein
MKLATQVRLFRQTSWPLAGAIFGPTVALVALFGWPVVPMFFGSMALFGATTWVVPGAIVRYAFARLRRLALTEDTVAARAVLGELLELYQGHPVTLESLHFSEASLLSMEERYAEASTVLESLDRRRMGPRWEPWVANNLAWSLAHCGRVAEAVAMARAALEAKDGDGGRGLIAEDLRAHQLGTLGACLVLSGDAATGAPYLEQALARGGRPRARAARAFYLGGALRALGRDDEAAKAYTRAFETAPENPFGRRAKERIGELRPYR